MSKNAITPAEHLPAPAQLFRQARVYHEAARLHSALGCAAMVMAGAEILRLQKELKIDGSGGSNSAPRNLNLPDGKTWVELIEENTGMSKSTVYKYREMAMACAKKVKDLSHLITAAPCDITDDQREQIAKAVHRVTDGHTATELFREWGIAKLDPSAEARKAKTKQIAEELPADPAEAEAQIREQTKQEKAEADCREWLMNSQHYFLKLNAWKLLPDDLLDESRKMAAAILERIGKPRA